MIQVKVRNEKVDQSSGFKKRLECTLVVRISYSTIQFTNLTLDLKNKSKGVE